MHVNAHKGESEMQLGNSILVGKQQARLELGGISMRTLDTLIAEKRLPVIRIGRRVLIRRAALEAFARKDFQPTQ